MLGGGEGECPGPNDQWVGPTTSALSACSFSGSQIFPASVTSTRRDAPVRLDRLPLFFHGSQLCGAALANLDRPKQAVHQGHVLVCKSTDVVKWR